MKKYILLLGGIALLTIASCSKDDDHDDHDDHDHDHDHAALVIDREVNLA